VKDGYPENPLEVLRFDRRALTGTRGLILTFCAVVTAAAMNFINRFGLPEFMGKSDPVTQYPMLSTVAAISVGCSVIIAAFISIHSWSVPPKPGQRDYSPFIAVIMLLGFLGFVIGLDMWKS
jgi:hypothetical protein